MIIQAEFGGGVHQICSRILHEHWGTENDISCDKNMGGGGWRVGTRLGRGSSFGFGQIGFGKSSHPGGNVRWCFSDFITVPYGNFSNSFFLIALPRGILTADILHVGLCFVP
jgi:hypothetical protein